MRTFIILWLGQFTSALGSTMTYFALTLWVWQQTQSATAIALVMFFSQLPQIAIALFSGILVDRFSRRHLLFLSDTVAAGCTLSIGLLSATDLLQVWHLYPVAAIIGCVGHIQTLTYSTIIPAIVPPQHHTRASSMGAMVGYSANILAPAGAGLLYPIVGLFGITAIDLGTFAIAIGTLLAIRLPPNLAVENTEDTQGKRKLWQDVTFGFRYIAQHPILMRVAIAMAVFGFLHQIGETLYQPMILARTGGDTQLLGTVVAASGLGGVVGSIVLSVWGGFRRHTVGLLLGMVGTGLSQLVLGLGRSPAIWGAARFGVSFHNPLVFSSNMALWYAQVAPHLQGRVFAADYAIGLVVESSASLTAGLLADRLFEPAMRSGSEWATRMGAIVGTGAGSGIALLFALNAVGILLVGIAGFALQQFRDRLKLHQK